MNGYEYMYIYIYYFCFVLSLFVHTQGTANRRAPCPVEPGQKRSHYLAAHPRYEFAGMVTVSSTPRRRLGQT